MSSITKLTTLVLAACAARSWAEGSIPLVGFVNDDPKFTFVELNDPVMGGKSTGTWTVESSGKYGIFDGEVVNVPSLKAPGFIKAAADGSFVDASSALGGAMLLSVRTKTPEYKGFRIAFAAGTLSPSYACSGGGTIPLSRGCFKADFSVPSGDDFTTVRVPLTAFSDMWSPATGDHTKNCTDDSSVCPTASSLSGIKRVEFWAEGVAGKVHLEVESVTMEPPSEEGEVVPLSAVESAVRPPAQFDQCKSAVQPNLRYNISSRMNANPYVDTGNESLAEAVCCDKRMEPFAETQFLFEAPDIQLFSKLEASGVTTFYDSACGVPVFRAPVNRSLAEFKEDTTEHGWPSFRTAEVVTENVRTDQSTGYVTSSCGTHLGSYLPDAKGSRWCIDLSCIAGNAA